VTLPDGGGMEAGLGRLLAPCAAALVSFDIDGTLEVGYPPGPLPLAVVRAARDLGCVVGSCSDRPSREQAGLWAEHAVGVDFTCPKGRLSTLRDRFARRRYVHVGDTVQDELEARRAGFEFLPVAELFGSLFGSGR
jgi:hypothetical protein